MYSLHPTLMCQASYILLLSKTKVFFSDPKSARLITSSAFQDHDRYLSDQFEMAITRSTLPIFFQTSGRPFQFRRAA